MWTFTSPRLIVYGEDALSFLEGEKAVRVLIVADESMLKLGYVDLVKNTLKAEKIEIFSEVEPEPSIETTLKCVEVAKKLQPELILAVGGGSVIDVAKATRILMELEIDPIAITPFTDLFELGYRRKAKFIAIPTTSGTGADVTWTSILTDKAEQRKLTPANREMVPDITLLDYRFVAEMPRRLVAGSGMDALTHAIEGFVSVWRNEFSDAFCEKAVEIIMENLEKSYKGDLEARAKMHIAATMAGLGFGNSQVGLAHSFGHTFGAIFKLHHGVSVGLFLPYVMQFYLKSEIKSRIDLLARKNGFQNAEELICRIIDLIKNLQLPNKLSEIVSREEFGDKLESLVMNTLNDSSLGMSPRIPDYDQVKKIYEYAFEGKWIDF
ncbi:MAG: iron-containing alcohol dehydrogenase [Archaeoglobaceae archaeon]|nr:iron-containing alcohol dehydrogenase [Archaeoglobaceae archaeon]MDW8128257.1 iron-containing alcohol dehydrogenase [Archaeoglobaceae archaeon]